MRRSTHTGAFDEVKDRFSNKFEHVIQMIEHLDKDPPSWGPEQEMRNPFNRWVQKPMIWPIQAQDLDPSHQVTAIIGQLSGEAQELALGRLRGWSALG